MTGRHRTVVLAGVDVGTTHCKAVVCAQDGTVVSTAQRRTPVDSSGHGHDVTLLCRAALDALADAVTAAGQAPDAVGITGMAETGAPLDAAGSALLPALSWSDTRSQAQVDRLRRDHGAAELHRATGVLPSIKTPLARWLWLRDEHAETMRRMRCWAGAADLVAHALTGSVATDITFAQRTMAWDVHAAAWHADLLALAGLDAERMPEVRAPGVPVAVISRAGAAAFGGVPGVPVVVAGHDHLVGAWAAQLRATGESADSMGTAEAVIALADQPPDPTAVAHEGMSYGRYVDGTHWCVVAGMSSSGALVEWFCDRMLGLAGTSSAERYRRFAELVGQARPGPTGICVEPYLHGRSAPRPDPARRLGVHGLTPAHGLPELAKALLEGASHQARWTAETQGELLGAAPKSVTVLGGSVRQRAWMDIKAAVSPWRTEVCETPEAACLGAAAWAGAALGLDPTATVAARRVVSVAPATAAAYQARHESVFLPTVTARPTAGARPAAHQAT